jgi:hypothetical protein
MPETLPEDQPARADLVEAEATLRPLVEAGNPYAQRLLALLSANGQTWLKAVTEVLARPSTSLVAYALLDAISRYFNNMGYPLQAAALEDVFPCAEAMAKGESERPESLKLLCEAAPGYTRSIQAMLALSALSSKLADPWLMRNTAVGALMRRKIEPMIKPIQREVDVLRSPGQ